MLITGIICVVVLVIAWELLRRFSCLNCFVGLICIGIGLVLLIWFGFVPVSLGG